MGTILTVLTDTFEAVLLDQPDRMPPRPQILLALASIPNDLKTLSIGTGDWSVLEQWIAKVRGLLGADSQPLAESLLFRALEYLSPRLAGSAIVMGLIEHDFTGDQVKNHRIVWDRLFTFLTRPQDLFDFWVSKIASQKDVQLLQVYLPTLIYAPLAFLVLEHERQGFSALPAALPLRPELADLLAATVSSPTPLPMPPGGLFNLSTFENLVSDVNHNVKPVLTSWQAIVTGPMPPDRLSNLDLEAQLTVPANASDLISPNFDLGNGWNLRVSSVVPAGGKTDLHYHNGKWDAAAGTVQGELISFAISKEGSPAVSLGDTKTLLIEIARLKLFAAIRAPAAPGATTGLFSVGMQADQLSVTSKALGLDLLGGGDGLKAATDLRSEFVQGEGLRAQAGGPGASPAALGMDFVTPLNRSIGGTGAGVTIGTLHTRVEVAPDPPAGTVIGLLARVRLTFDAKGSFGPVDAVADGLGAWFGRWRDAAGKLQYADLIPPDGVGISLSAGPIGGGGFLSVQKIEGGVRFGGALSLKLGMIGIGALGLVEKKGSDVSFIVILGIRFTPGIQLSFGFELTGVGGLVGINRRADLDQLRERLASGAAGNVLFCADPVNNGPALIGDLESMFPGSAGTFLVGPTLQLAWISPIVRLDFGVLIEMPGPRKILLVGSARAIIGTDDAALVSLRLDFAGGIDLVQQVITFDASLVNSTVLGFLTLTGDVAFRLCYGDRPDVVLSIGGFHPAFNAESLHLRPLARAAASYSINAGVKIWLRQEAYFAFTSNTLQVGGRTEAGMEIGPLGAHGFLALDAMVQFKPFYFTVSFAAGFGIDFEGESFAEVTVSGQISGPGPLVITASASIKLLFIKVSHSETFRLGSDHPDEAPALTGVLDELKKELVIPENLQASGDDPQVHVKPVPRSASLAVFSPLGRLTWTQKLTPLETTITRFGGQRLDGPHTVAVAVGTPSAGLQQDTAKDWFSPGHFMDLNQSQQLNNPAMQSLAAGKGLSATLESSTGLVPANANEINIIKLPRKMRRFWSLKNVTLLQLSAAHSETLRDRLQSPAIRGGDARVKVGDESWQVLDAGGVPTGKTYSAIEAFQQTRYVTRGGIAAPVQDQPVNVTNV